MKGDRNILTNTIVILDSGEVADTYFLLTSHLLVILLLIYSSYKEADNYLQNLLLTSDSCKKHTLTG